MIIQAFFKENVVEAGRTVEFVVSKRFVDEEGNPIPWVLRTMTPRKYIELSNRVAEFKKGGVAIGDMGGAMFALMEECVVEPNLKDQELQDSYGAMGVADLLDKMLTTSEFTALNIKLTQMHGGDQPLDEMVDEVKND